MTERLARLAPAQLSADQRSVYDHIAGGPRARGPRLFAMTDELGGLHGPFNAMLVAPGVGDALQALGAAVRYGTSLSDRVREMAILAVATYWSSEFERYAHEAVGRAAGLSDGELLALRDLPALRPEDPLEAAALDVVRALLVQSDLDDTAYVEAVEMIGEAALVELTTLVGYYATLALMMRVFRTGLPSATS